ncbi:MAG: hypothetical protein QOH59_2194 [Gemmatimonadales bacterium]|jgi:predicted molibdopterin-dependent oxidoreductase YjgC|nr:hypothetical protein [Gemmatimonadales bacterium]
MQFGAAEYNIVAELAQKAGVDALALAQAVESEVPAEVARVLSISEAEAARRLEPLRRAATVGEDWGAGCRLLTDDVCAEIHTALRSLLPGDHSASLGVSQG